MYYYYNMENGEYTGCGNEPTAPEGCEARITPPAPPVPSQEEIKKELTNYVQISILNAKANEREYDSVDSATKYIGGPDLVWAAEGTALRDWAVVVWKKYYAVMSEVLAGSRLVPSKEDLAAEIYADCPFVWP